MSSNSIPPHRIAKADLARPAKRRRNDTYLRDALLVALAFAWGSIDAISFGGLGKVYSTAQTGNLITLGLGAGGCVGGGVCDRCGNRHTHRRASTRGCAVAASVGGRPCSHCGDSDWLPG